MNTLDKCGLKILVVKESGYLSGRCEKMGIRY